MSDRYGTVQAEDAQFFRRYDVPLGQSSIVTEIDQGFIGNRMVYHAHNHASVELIAVRNGINVIDTMEETYGCETGAVLLVPKGVYHTNRPTDTQSDRICFRFYPKDGAFLDEWKPLGDFLYRMTKPTCFDLPALLPVLEKIREELCEDGPLADEMILSLFRECYILLLRRVIGDGVGQHSAAVSRRSTPEEKRLKIIERFFSRRYAEAVTLSDLAEALYISSTQTNRILKRKYGQSFREKLRDTRLHQARLLLKNTTLPANDIAGEVGYASVAAFFSAFRKAFGMTPAAYREKIADEATGRIIGGTES